MNQTDTWQRTNATMNCDWLAPHYRWAEHLTFGKLLERCRFTFLGEIQSAKRALLCGDGDGRFLSQLLRLNSKVVVDYVDLSSRMADLARRRAAELGPTAATRVQFHVTDARLFIPPDCGYDLICCHFFLDCFPQQEVEFLVRKFADFSVPGGQLLVSDFAVANSWMHRWWTASLIRLLYAGFFLTTGLTVTSLPNCAAALSSENFFLQSEVALAGGLLRSAIWRKPYAHPMTQQPS